jgi:formylglycine-generating enzyme required for sulfatase activity
VKCHAGHGEGRQSAGKVLPGVRAETGSDRVIRGGSWNNNARNCRTANRNRNSPDNRNDNIGFRLCFF